MDSKLAPIRKGLLEFLVLKIVGASSAYVPDILRRLSGTEFATQEGTLYPLLSKLRREDLVQYEWQESDAGPPRKYYRLTEAGKGQLAALEAAALLPAAGHGWLAVAAVPEQLPPPAPEPAVSPLGDACVVGPHGGRHDGRSEPYPGMVPVPAVTAVGVASCATVSCHGGPLDGDHDVQSFAATIWCDSRIK
jgi:PadR family transcriptional regulator PadR